MIVLEAVTVTYPGATRPTLREVDLHVPEGELCLVVGSTGSGKSTLLGTVSGLVPHFTGGRLDGRVVTAGRDTAFHPPRELADVVGVVAQDPSSGFVTDIVEEELAYAMEQLAVPPDVMRRRVEEVLDLLGLADLRSRPLATLSGGQQQRTAIASVLAAGPRILVLDEPTSALDPSAAEEVLAAITRLVHDLGITVFLAEHRLERVAQYADRVVWVPGDGSVVAGDPGDVLARASVAPPVVELGEIAGWEPVPRSVRDARRQAPELRERLSLLTSPTQGRRLAAEDVAARLSGRQLIVTYGQVVAVRGVDLDLRPGEVTALMGRNGAGKSSLLWALQGSGPRAGGTVAVVDPTGTSHDPARLSRADARRLVGMVPQTASDLLYLATVAEELEAADHEAGAPAGTTRTLLNEMAGGIDDRAHPRDLSEGQRLALVLAIQLAAAPPVLLLDEPTRGLDYAAKRAFTATVRALAAQGRSVVVASHDVELVASTADRVVIMAEGEVVADGAAAEVVLSSPAFAPQVAKVLQPSPWLTVDEVATALGCPVWRRTPRSENAL